MEFQKMIDRAMTVRHLYEEMEKHSYGAAWTSEEIMLGFAGDVGDLAKLITAENGRRTIPGSKEKLRHELADCLWSVIVLARLHEVDLEQSFMETMDKLENHLLETQE